MPKEGSVLRLAARIRFTATTEVHLKPFSALVWCMASGGQIPGRALVVSLFIPIIVSIRNYTTNGCHMHETRYRNLSRT